LLQDVLVKGAQKSNLCCEQMDKKYKKKKSRTIAITSQEGRKNFAYL